MENNRIDRLFQDKLVRQELEPTNEAWAQVQAGLSKREKKPDDLVEGSRRGGCA